MATVFAEIKPNQPEGWARYKSCQIESAYREVSGQRFPTRDLAIAHLTKHGFEFLAEGVNGIETWVKQWEE